jgi:hypothetical protein
MVQTRQEKALDLGVTLGSGVQLRSGYGFYV